MKKVIALIFILCNLACKKAGSSSTIIDTAVTNIAIDASVKYQTMEGFGGFGAQDVYWSRGPFTSSTFVNNLINDLGLTILRDNVPTDFEDVNDDNDANTTNLDNFHYGSFTDHIQYLKDMKAAGLQKLIISCWSAPAWMKTNNNVNGDKADAPAYNPNPTSANNQLRTDMYEEFAERCVAYIKIVQQETGMDVYAISLQNWWKNEELHGANPGHSQTAIPCHLPTIPLHILRQPPNFIIHSTTYNHIQCISV